MGLYSVKGGIAMGLYSVKGGIAMGLYSIKCCSISYIHLQIERLDINRLLLTKFQL